MKIFYIYSPTIFKIIRYKLIIKIKLNTIKNQRNLGVLNKFLKGVNITKTNPEKIEIEEENKIIEINNNPNQTKIIDLNYTMNEK